MASLLAHSDAQKPTIAMPSALPSGDTSLRITAVTDLAAKPTDGPKQKRIRAAKELGAGPVDTHPARRVNPHGVFLDVDLHLRMTGNNAAQTRAEIRVIEDLLGWHVATSWTLEKGQYRGFSAPLSIHGQPFEHRGKALKEGKNRIVEATRQAAKEDHKSVERAKREAAEIHSWLRTAVEQPDWFDKMTPDEHRLEDKDAPDEQSTDESTSEKATPEKAGTQETLF